jgi:hypothetical protein
MVADGCSATKPRLGQFALQKITTHELAAELFASPQRKIVNERGAQRRLLNNAIPRQDSVHGEMHKRS